MSHLCGACKSNIINDDSNNLECCDCGLSYHSLCVSIPHAELEKLSSEAKAIWLCPECLMRKPRTDNTHTPVRSLTPNPSNADANVTHRVPKKGSKQISSSAPGAGSSKQTATGPKQATVASKQSAAGSTKPSSTCSESRSELRTIIQEEIRAAMKEASANLKRDINKELKTFKEDMVSLTESINFIHETFENMKSELSTCKTKIDSISKENETLRSELNTISNRFNQLEQITRSSNLEVQCVPERDSENLLTIIKQLGKTISCPITDSDIFYCSRVAKKNPESPRPRSILVKMNSPRSRDTFLAAAIKYNKTHPQERLNTGNLGFGAEKREVYVVENLSPENKQLHAAARARARELHYKHVWVRGGRIYMRKTDTSEYVLVRNAATLDSLM